MLASVAVFRSGANDCPNAGPPLGASGSRKLVRSNEGTNEEISAYEAAAGTLYE
jgi:hypothetical protein